MTFEEELLTILNQIPGAIEKAFTAFVERHPGHANQKTHGNRFGAGQAKESLRRLKDDKGAREQYKQRFRGKAIQNELKSRPKLREGLSYGEDIDIKGLKVGQVLEVPGTDRRGRTGGTISKVKPRNVDYEIDYMGKPLTLTIHKDELKGAYAMADRKVHKIK